MKAGGRPSAVVLLAIVLAALAWSRVALAHEFRPALLRVIERGEAEAGGPGRFDLRLSTPALAVDGPIAEGELTPIVPAHCELKSRSPVAFDLDCGTEGLVGPLGVAGLEGRDLDVVVELRRVDGSRHTALLGPEQPILELDALGSRSRWATFVTYLRLGVEHILLGFDHLLFVLGLTLLVRERKTLLWTITAFTVAHSLTLAASTLELLTLPGPPVEAAIALSILLLARELALGRREDRRETLSWRYPWLVALSFGLLHGFGFAGALRELGLASDQLGLSLLAFNLGVELGQLLVVGLVWLLLGRLARARGSETAGSKDWMGWMIHGMGALAFAWTLERVLVVIRP